MVRRQEIGTLATSRARITVALLLGLVGICLIAAFIAAPSSRRSLTFVAAVTAGASGVYSTYYAAASIRGQIDLGRKQTALRFIEAWPSEERTTERHALREIQADKLTAEQLVDKIKHDSKLERAARTHLNFIHAMAVAVESETVDERLLYDYFHLIVKDTFQLVEPYIAHERERHGEREIWSHAEKLNTRWLGSPPERRRL